LLKGATFSMKHSLDQMLHLRPHNRFEDVDGIYLTGGGTHPGSGLPVIFQSARIRAESPDKVVFTGSSHTGQTVLSTLAETATPAVVELSGADAILVTPDADLKLVARAVAFGLRLNGGAVCMSPRRLFASTATMALLRPLLIEALRDVPPVQLNATTSERLRLMIASSIDEGAQLLGDLTPDAQRPVLIDSAKPSMEIARSDIFAPVLSLLAADTMMHIPGRGLREEPLARRQGRAAQRKRLPLRYGPDHPDSALRPAQGLRGSRTQAGRLYPMVRLDPQWRCFFDDGSRIDLKDDAAGDGRTLEAVWPAMGAAYLKFLEMSKQLHSISDRFFFWRSIGSIKDTMDVGGAFDLNVLRDVMRMRLAKTVAGTIREFIPDANTAQMLDHFVQYVGSSPDASPAILCAIGHMQMEEGIWYPMGGTRAVPEALVKARNRAGVVFHPDTDVSRSSPTPRATEARTADASPASSPPHGVTSTASTPSSPTPMRCALIAN
jgi:hypothetical protein